MVLRVAACVQLLVLVACSGRVDPPPDGDDPGASSSAEAGTRGVISEPPVSVSSFESGDGETPQPACERLTPLPDGYASFALFHFEEPGGAAVMNSADHLSDQGSTLNLDANGTVVGGSRGEGACGRGITFDGIDTRIEIGPVGDVFHAGIAVELWVRPKELQDGEIHLLGDGGGGVASFQLVLDHGVPVFKLMDTGGVWRELLRAPTTLEEGVWQHVHARYDGDAGRLFIDGAEVTSVNRIVPIEGSYNMIYVGGVTSVADCCPIVRELIGDVDEVAVWAQ